MMDVAKSCEIQDDAKNGCESKIDSDNSWG